MASYHWMFFAGLSFIAATAAGASSSDPARIEVSLLATDPATSTVVLSDETDPMPRTLKVGQAWQGKGWRGTLVHMGADRAFFDGAFVTESPDLETDKAKSNPRSRPFELTVLRRLGGERFSKVEIRDPSPEPQPEPVPAPSVQSIGEPDPESQVLSLRRDRGLRPQTEARTETPTENSSPSNPQSEDGDP